MARMSCGAGLPSTIYLALLDHVAVLKVNVLRLRDQVLDRLRALLARLDAQALLVLEVAPEPHRAGDFGDDRVILRPARLEQLRNARQTAGDVAGLGAVDRDARDDVARLHLAPGSNEMIDSTDSSVARVAATRQLGDLAVLALDDDRRLEARGAL